MRDSNLVSHDKHGSSFTGGIRLLVGTLLGPVMYIYFTEVINFIYLLYHKYIC